MGNSGSGSSSKAAKDDLHRHDSDDVNTFGRGKIFTPIDESKEFASHLLQTLSERSIEPSPGHRDRTHTVTPGTQLDMKKLPTVFKWDGSGKEVYLCGSFNNWKVKIKMVKSQGDFYSIIDLPEGEHQYKFFVDGQWKHDPNEPTVPNAMGTLNNVLFVKKSDFEVMEALAMDSISASPSSKDGFNVSPTGSYTNLIPERATLDRHASPPVLPPHLLEVVLNKETAANCEPTLLPEPNHVMLNHLYALSIRDGVMVLSAAHRFRKRYVTTLIYKPIQTVLPRGQSTVFGPKLPCLLCRLP